MTNRRGRDIDDGPQLRAERLAKRIANAERAKIDADTIGCLLTELVQELQKEIVETQQEVLGTAKQEGDNDQQS